MIPELMLRCARWRRGCGGVMKRIPLLVFCLCLLGMAGCSGDKGKELFETAQFEEKQLNREHAIQLYREIVTRYPRSAAAPQAEERLRELTKGK